ncbi:MAG TPA: glycerophosphodiester phosphodiesterase [Solirubrobacteraceae bacterium]|nr:glycerophosphodiester phosphodiesterase [Solirubrobacteraceae bacterium]
MSTVIRVGHKGADLIAPGNTFASFDAALTAGVDMIEFDVLPEQLDGSGGLFLAHDYVDLAGRSAATLEEGLRFLSLERFSGIDFLVDLKLPGYELRVVEALEAAGLVGRALISTQYIESLDKIRASGSRVRLSWTVPKLRRDPFRSPFTAPFAYAALIAARAILPARAATAIRAGRCDVLTAHWRLVTPRLVRAVTGAGGELFVWTVDELPRIRALAALGVNGLITNDPRLFAAPAG